MSHTKNKFAKGAIGKTIPIYDFVPDHEEQKRLIDHGIASLYDLFCLSHSAIKEFSVDPEILYGDISAVKTIPVSELNVSAQIIDSLQKNGIHTIGQIIMSDLGLISLLSGVNDDVILQILSDLEHLSFKIDYYRILSGEKPIIRKKPDENDDDENDTDIHIAIDENFSEVNNNSQKKEPCSLYQNQQKTNNTQPTVEKFLSFFENQKLLEYADDYVETLWDLETIANRRDRIKRFKLFDDSLKNCCKTVRYLQLYRKGSSWDTRRIRNALNWYIAFLDSLLDMNRESDKKIHNDLQKLKTKDVNDRNTHFHSYYLGKENSDSEKEKPRTIANKKSLSKGNVKKPKQNLLENSKELTHKASANNNKNNLNLSKLHDDEPKIKRSQVDPAIIELTRITLEKLCEQNPEGVSPAMWLSNHPKHYSENTIKRYVRALQKAAEWMNIELPKPILEIKNEDEFQAVHRQIKEHPDYDNINHAHGHGDLSAALALYEQYLEEIIQNKDQINRAPGFFSDYGGCGIMVTKRPIKNIIAQVKTYIAGRGFTYEDGMIENFWLSLKSKPFVILAGTSGTGKTRLVKLFAEAIGAEYRLLPVRPDWSDSSDLLGHHNLAGEFVPGRVLNIILEALKEPEKPFILCLDEMNLARVEYYLSDFLSVIETRDLKDGKIVSDRLLPRESYGDIRFPENLYLVGTVNMDETTFPFSKKVLDRANTIEFNTVDLMPPVSDFNDEVFPIETGNDFLKSEYLFLSQCLNEENREFIDSVCSDLETINRVLKANNAHVGYRVRDEIVFYMLNNRNADLLSRDDAMDNAVMQKILPRIQGSSAAVKDMLCELFKIFAGDFEGYQTRNNDTASGMFDKLSKSSDIRYPKSAEKTAFMVRRFDEDGFTSYWL